MFLRFLPEIKKVTEVTKEQLVTDNFLIEKENELAMFYAPHNEYINTEAKVIIVGITPGWNQMKVAYEQLIQSLEYGLPTHTALKNAKIAASFSGIMRNNLTKMLDEIGLAGALKIRTTNSLFTSYRDNLHTTSVIKYPVFLKEKNYTGHIPAIDQSTLLKRYAYEEFPKEIAEMNHPTLIIPLGKATEHIVRGTLGKYTEHTYLFGFPHPSGANGHRKRQLLENKDQLKQKVKQWIDR